MTDRYVVCDESPGKMRALGPYMNQWVAEKALDAIEKHCGPGSGSKLTNFRIVDEDEYDALEKSVVMVNDTEAFREALRKKRRRSSDEE